MSNICVVSVCPCLIALRQRVLLKQSKLVISADQDLRVHYVELCKYMLSKVVGCFESQVDSIRSNCYKLMALICIWFIFPNSALATMQEAEEAAAAKAAKLEAHAAAAAAAANPEIAKSPSDFSCHSYELFVGQEKGNDDNNKEKMSIRSEGLESVSEITRTTAPTATAAGTAKARKVSAVSMRTAFCTSRPNCSCLYPQPLPVFPWGRFPGKPQQLIECSRATFPLPRMCVHPLPPLISFPSDMYLAFSMWVSIVGSLTVKIMPFKGNNWKLQTVILYYWPRI